MTTKRNGLTENVQKKIAFEVFATDKTHQEIADEFGGIHRSTVTHIAKKYNIQRYPGRGANGGRPLGQYGKYELKDIETINWTFDDELILERIKRREDNLHNEINRIIKAAINL